MSWFLVALSPKNWKMITKMRVTEQIAWTHTPLITRKSWTHTPLIRRKFWTHTPLITRKVRTYTPIITRKAWTHTPLITRKRKRQDTEQEEVQEDATNTIKEIEGIHTEEGWEGGGRSAKGEGTSNKGKYGAHVKDVNASNENHDTTDNFRQENHLTNRKRRRLQRTISW